MKTISVTGGYGAVGSALCRILVEQGHTVRIAGRTEAKARALKEKLGSAAQVFVVDAASPESLDPLLDGADLLANCAGPYRAIRDVPARAARKHNIPYIDAAGDEFLMGILEKEKPAYAATGAAYLVSAGTYPGLSGIFPRALAQKYFDTVESFRLHTDFSYCTVTLTAAVDIVATLQNDTGSGMSFWQDGQLVRDSRGMQPVRLPGRREALTAYPCFSEEMQRTADAIMAYEGHAFLDLNENDFASLFTCCAPGLSPEEQKKAAENLVTSFATDSPETLFYLEMEGEKNGSPLACASTFFAPVGSLQYVATIMAASIACIEAGQCVPGANYLAGGCDPVALLENLEKAGAKITTSPLA